MKTMPIIPQEKQLQSRLFIIRNPSFSDAAKNHAQKLIEEEFARLLNPQKSKEAK